MTLKVRTPLPPSWDCRCESCLTAVSHGAPEIDRDYDALAERADALKRALSALVRAVEEIGNAETLDGTLYERAAAHRLATPSAPKGPQQTTTGKGTE